VRACFDISLGEIATKAISIFDHDSASQQILSRGAGGGIASENTD
jgi:hypothetical protein